MGRAPTNRGICSNASREVLSRTCDMRVPLTFDADDCALIATIVREEVERLVAAGHGETERLPG